MKKISVAICTFNRARLLEGALDSLFRARRLEQLDWEVIVVLNNCTDESRDVVERSRDRLPMVCVVEPRPGLSHARNRAIDSAVGDVVIWIDDDVRVDAGWLRAYERAFLRWPDASVFGGAILPKFEGTPPAWLIQAWRLCDSAFAARRVPDSDAAIVSADDYIPYGANFAVRMPVQRQFRYDIRLGPRPGRWIINGEETEVIRAILAGGGTGRWVRAAVVEHVMPEERQTIQYVRKYYESCGRLSELGACGEGSRPSRADNVRDRCIVIASEMRFRLLKAVAGPQQWVPALVHSATAHGRWIGRYHRDSEVRLG